MASRWRYGRVTLYTSSGHVITFDGAARVSHDNKGWVGGYETKGGPEWLLLPPLASLTAISVTEPTDG